MNILLCVCVCVCTCVRERERVSGLSTGLQWVKHVTHTGEMAKYICVNEQFTCKTRNRWENNIKTDLKEKDVDWI